MATPPRHAARRTASRTGKARTGKARKARLLGSMWALALRLQCATWRVRIEGLAPFDLEITSGRGAIAAFWHGTYVPLFALLRNRDAVVFTSHSFRGSIIAQICDRFGYRGVQIPNHAGDRAIAFMRRRLAGERAAGIAVDGPRGPYHAVKRGAIQLASALGWPIYPMSVAADRSTIFAGRWDRREVPKAFSRVALAVGDPLELPDDLDALAPWTERLGKALAATDRRATILANRPALRSS